jgi:nucleoid DNA-binding protein
VTKKDIVRQISEQVDVPQLKTKEIVQATFDAIIETLVREGRIELRKFGVFEVKRRKARRARNPKTNEDVEVGPKNVVTFQPGKKMEDRVRQMPLVTERPRKPRKSKAAGAVEPLSVSEASQDASQLVATATATNPHGV